MLALVAQEGELRNPMSAAVWKKEDGVGLQPTPTVTMYTEAMNKFTKSATAFMDQVHILTEARDAYQEAMAASTALRERLDAGDQTLRSLMTQLEQVVSAHLGEHARDRKRPEPVKVEANGTNGENTDFARTFL